VGASRQRLRLRLREQHLLPVSVVGIGRGKSSTRTGIASTFHFIFALSLLFLHSSSVTSSRLFPITADGRRGVIFNGIPDWVYEGECLHASTGGSWLFRPVGRKPHSLATRAPIPITPNDEAPQARSRSGTALPISFWPRSEGSILWGRRLGMPTGFRDHSAFIYWSAHTTQRRMH